MSKKQINIKGNVMEKIRENKISMKPKSFFVLGYIFTFIGLIASIVISIFLISLVSFLLKEYGPMGGYRLSLMLNNFPWCVAVLTVVGLASGIWLLSKYDFSYKINYLYIIIGFIIVMIIAGWAIDRSGIDNFWLNQGPMRRVMRQYMQNNNTQIKPNNFPQRGNRMNILNQKQKQ
jgi:hypothetical protein